VRVAWLVVRELRHRPFNAALGVCAVAVAAGGLVASIVALERFDVQTERLVAEKESALGGLMASTAEEVRKITNRMGFNILILPRDQDLADFYAQTYAEKTMPESFASTLAGAKDVVTIRHLLPMLQRRVEWPERRRRILLIGVRGEMPWAHRSDKAPLLKPVPPGTVTIGWELHRSLALSEGEAAEFMGEHLRVGTVHPERGTIDDITLWVELSLAQRLLGLEGRISAMMALECECAWADLAKVREEIGRVLPETQVIELAGKALARAEARREAARTARELVEREKAHRARLRADRAGLVATVVPIVVAAAVVAVGVLALLNVRERRTEIGVLRSLGVRTRQVLVVFLGRALTVGIAGAALGIASVLAWARVSEPPAQVGWPLVLGVAAAAPAIAAVASWLPALVAARQDPAAVMREG
jgi:putative ABC transport system permease protein